MRECRKNMERSEEHKLRRALLNERRRRAVKMSLMGVTIGGTAAPCELGRSGIIRATQADNRGVLPVGCILAFSFRKRRQRGRWPESIDRIKI